jgi:hypothetical protein
MQNFDNACKNGLVVKNDGYICIPTSEKNFSMRMVTNLPEYTFDFYEEDIIKMKDIFDLKSYLDDFNKLVEIFLKADLKVLVENLSYCAEDNFIHHVFTNDEELDEASKHYFYSIEMKIDSARKKDYSIRRPCEFCSTNFLENLLLRSKSYNNKSKTVLDKFSSEHLNINDFSIKKISGFAYACAFPQPIDLKVELMKVLAVSHEVSSVQFSNSNEENFGKSGPERLIDDEGMHHAKEMSRAMAESEGEIGPRNIADWTIHDVKDIGNCFYEAVVDQFQLLQHSFLQEVPAGTAAHDSLRLRLQGEQFRDEEWADDIMFGHLVRKFDVILAVVDTRHPETGFVCRFINESGEFRIVVDLDTPLPNKPLIKIAATGNHFLSVHAHPALTQGAYRAAASSPSTYSPTRLLIQSSPFVTSLQTSSSPSSVSQTPSVPIAKAPSKEPSRT